MVTMRRSRRSVSNLAMTLINVVKWPLVGSATGVLAAVVIQNMLRYNEKGSTTAISFQTADYGTSYWFWVLFAGTASGFAGGAIGSVIRMRADMADGTNDRLGSVVVAGLSGIAIGLCPLLTRIGQILADTQPREAVAMTTESLVLMYLGSSALAYAASLAAVYVTLTAQKDPWVRHTLRALAALLPGGAILGAGTGVGVAWLMGFATTTVTVVTIALAVAAVLSVALVCGRVWGLRPANGNWSPDFPV
jgi:hypothetical protein